MSLTFYPDLDDEVHGSLEERIDSLMESALRYKAIILDVALPGAQPHSESLPRAGLPNDLKAAFNWDEIAAVLREVRELPEGDLLTRKRKGVLLTKLAEVYETLRAAKMPKMEAVRLALFAEASHLLSGGG